MSEKKPREFIAYKRVKSSRWMFDENTEIASKAIDDIAPDGGNYEKILLREVLPEAECARCLSREVQAVEGPCPRCAEPEFPEKEFREWETEFKEWAQANLSAWDRRAKEGK